MHLALPAAVGRQKKIFRQLHGQRRRSLHLATGLNVTIGRSRDANNVDAGVLVEILIFNRHQRVAQHRREIVVTHDHAPLQRERSNHPPVVVIKLRDRARPVSFESVDLRQVRRIYQQQTGRCPYQHRDQHEQPEQNAADQPAPADFDFGKIFVERLH